MNRLVLATVAAVLVAGVIMVRARTPRGGPLLGPRRHVALSARQMVGLCLLLTWTLVEQPLGLAMMPLSSSTPAGLVAPLSSWAPLWRLLTSTAGLGLLQLGVIVASAVAVFSARRAGLVGLGVAAALATCGGGLSRGLFLSGYHQGLLPIVLAAAVIAVSAGRGDDDEAVDGDAWFVVRVVVAAVYIAAGMSKFRLVGLSFFGAEHQLGLIAECLAQHCNQLEGPLARPILLAAEHSSAMGVGVSALSVASVSLDLCFALAIWSGRWTQLVAALALVFHMGVVVIFGVVFVEFFIIDAALWASASFGRASRSRRATGIAGVVLIGIIAVVVTRVKAFPLSPFELFAHHVSEPLVVDNVLVDGVPTRLDEVFPAHAVASARRWQQTCFGPDEEVCDGWLEAIGVAADADVVVIERRVMTTPDVAHGKAGSLIESRQLRREQLPTVDTPGLQKTE